MIREPLENEVPRHRKKVAKKPFVIEFRLKGKFMHKDWNTWRRYASAKARDAALSALQSGRGMFHIFHADGEVEYRAVDK